MSSTADSGKVYHRSCTGPALQTVQQHTHNQDITLYASCFCPFVQRVWAALEYLQIPYKYYEVDPYQKPQELLNVSPKGLVPALMLNAFDPPRALNESTVILDFLEDIATKSTHRSLLPPSSDPYAKALVRLQSDHINRTLVPAFYRYLQAQDPDAQIAGGKEFHAAIQSLVELFERAEREVGGTGLWVEGGDLGWADVVVGPWGKFEAWLGRLFEDPAFKRTCSSEELYLDSYERYAFNRPNTSQVANAINSGRGLP
ncbi:glutathione S-transferase [Suillus paluster]|uniref:glutathione S-transferase n=1 Tax=Suillus paluster TaxID=48578 RepID=UPI001B884978|nr:glutathione S-transferase [Suillus paluster]KAG1735627.1 glutathione S-transferase [Suillus paluster]